MKDCEREKQKWETVEGLLERLPRTVSHVENPLSKAQQVCKNVKPDDIHLKRKKIRSPELGVIL